MSYRYFIMVKKFFRFFKWLLSLFTDVKPELAARGSVLRVRVSSVSESRMIYLARPEGNSRHWARHRTHPRSILIPQRDNLKNTNSEQQPCNIFFACNSLWLTSIAAVISQHTIEHIYYTQHDTNCWESACGGHRRQVITLTRRLGYRGF